MTHFPPTEAVLSSITLTRAAYAQLQGQVFHPPRVFGPEWHIREGEALDGERRWRDLGVKIATGFEIMYKEGGRKGRSGEVRLHLASLMVGWGISRRASTRLRLYQVSFRPQGCRLLW
jgi:hypothetical protein